MSTGPDATTPNLHFHYYRSGEDSATRLELTACMREALSLCSDRLQREEVPSDLTAVHIGVHTTLKELSEQWSNTDEEKRTAGWPESLRELSEDLRDRSKVRGLLVTEDVNNACAGDGRLLERMIATSDRLAAKLNDISRDLSRTGSEERSNEKMVVGMVTDLISEQLLNHCTSQLAIWVKKHGDQAAMRWQKAGKSQDSTWMSELRDSLIAVTCYLNRQYRGELERYLSKVQEGLLETRQLLNNYKAVGANLDIATEIRHGEAEQVRTNRELLALHRSSTQQAQKEIEQCGIEFRHHGGTLKAWCKSLHLKTSVFLRLNWSQISDVDAWNAIVDSSPQDGDMSADPKLASSLANEFSHAFSRQTASQVPIDPVLQSLQEYLNCGALEISRQSMPPPPRPTIKRKASEEIFDHA